MIKREELKLGHRYYLRSVGRGEPLVIVRVIEIEENQRIVDFVALRIEYDEAARFRNERPTYWSGAWTHSHLSARRRRRNWSQRRSTDDLKATRARRDVRT